MPFKSEPLPASFTVISLLGFVAALLYWNSGKISPPWGFTLALFCVIIFVASLISMRESVEIEHKLKKAEKVAPKKAARKTAKTKKSTKRKSRKAKKTGKKRKRRKKK